MKCVDCNNCVCADVDYEVEPDYESNCYRPVGKPMITFVCDLNTNYYFEEEDDVPKWCNNFDNNPIND